MRLSEKKQYRGYFWFPSWSQPEPKNRIPGKLVIDTNGTAGLTLEYPPWRDNLPRPKERKRPGLAISYAKEKRIHGIVEGNFVVLLECVCGTFLRRNTGNTGFDRISDPSSVHIHKDEYSSEFCIMGPCYEQGIIPKKTKIDFNDTSEVEFDTLYFFVDRLDGFLSLGRTECYIDGISDEKIPIRMRPDPAQNTRLEIKWHKGSTEILSCDDFTLRAESVGSLDYDWDFFSRTSGTTIRESIRWVLKFRNPSSRPLEECVKKIEDIKDFFSFVFNRNIGITYLAGSREEGCETAIQYQIHYPIGYLDPKTTPRRVEPTSIKYDDFITDKSENVFGKYLVSYLKKCEDEKWFRTVFFSHLFNIPRAGNFMHLFKELISTLEYVAGKDLKSQIERSGFSCDESLVERIRAFVKNGKCYDEVELLAKHITDIRNTFAHGRKDDVDSDIAKELYWWLWKITSFYLLSKIKDNDDLNRKIVEKSHRR